jgi:hypothetical protein
MGERDLYVIVLQTFTVIIVIVYIFTYIYTLKKLDPAYLTLLSTARTLILAIILIYFYHPFHKSYHYGHSMPFFAFSAGVSLLLLLDRNNILNLLHFLLYGKLMDNKIQP